jgi:hypothetical protein
MVCCLEQSLRSSTLKIAEALRPAQTSTTDESYVITPFVNRNGWVNPEDLAPMPQCIAQQDQSIWLNVMTRCTHRQCTRHFGVICTHQQWLTQLSCLSAEFSPDFVSQYLPFCSRSVLAKAQLFHWIRTITGRTWLVEVGDANGLQTPSSVSLERGYTAVRVTDKAPTCLTESVVGLSNEPFQHAMASCSFPSDTRHTGNAARPWEYREPQGTMVALDFETAAYDLTLRRIAYGDYFDKRCFCELFSTKTKTEPCLGPGLALTRERLWLNATCGSESLPADWTNELHTTTFAYIPTENWRWPECITAMPRKVVGLVDQCTTDACELDSDGYCNAKRAVDRACFCRSMNYDSCEGPCHVFEARIDFVKWLHGLCGNVEEWHGLPKHWRQLAAPTSTDMIPWRWNVTPYKDSDPTLPRSKNASTCSSTKWKLESVVLTNLATLIACLYTQSFRHRYAHPQSWLVPGLAIAALQLSANWINAALVQATAGYEAISVVQLTLLWCSMPRLTWSTILLVVLHPFRRKAWYIIASFLFAEAILQALSAYFMIQTINYGRQHDFYSQGMARLEETPAAQYMYAGAVMWLVVIVVTSVLLLQAAHRFVAQPGSQTSRPSAPTIARDLMTSFDNQWIGFEERLARYWLDKDCDPEERPLAHGGDHSHAVYGTTLNKDRYNRTIQTERAIVRLKLIAITSMFLLWIAQWMFWAGLIDLTSKEYVLLRRRFIIVELISSRYCPPKLELLTTVWIVTSAAVTVVAMSPRVE